MRILRWGAAGILAVTGLTAIVAQTVDGLDVQAVKRRAAEMEQEARDFSEQV
ncbi:MAG: type-F conjugative transfer system pilin assembly protein TrbC, partial [Stutzerimonas stutzeri]